MSRRPAGAYTVEGRLPISREMRDFAERRVRPLLDRHGVETRSVSHLLQEAYLNGIKDASDAMERPAQDKSI